MTTILILVPAALIGSAILAVLGRGIARDREVLVQLTDGSQRRVRLKSLRR